MKRFFVAVMLLTAATFIITGCGGGGGGSDIGGGGGISVAISPSNPTVAPGGTVQLSVTVSGTTNTSVTWTKTGGSLMVSGASGTFTAPTTLGTYNVTAKSDADPTKSATARIVVSNSIPTTNVTISIAPSSPALSPGESVALTVTVGGTSNTSVTWTKSGGSLAASGNSATFTAPSTPGTYTVRATSVADPSKFATASILVSEDAPPPPPPI